MSLGEYYNLVEHNTYLDIIRMSPSHRAHFFIYCTTL